MAAELVDYKSHYKHQVFPGLVPFKLYNKYTTGSMIFKILRYLGIYENRLLLLKNEDDIVLGSVVIRGKISPVRLRKEWYIYGVAVNSRFRGKGYGDLLVKHTVSRIRQMNLSIVYLLVENENKAAMNLYLKNGFVISRRKKWLFEKNIVVMELIL